MQDEIVEILDRRFAELGIGHKSLDRANQLGTDAGTFSKIVNGKLTLSEKRAKGWADALFPDDHDAATTFATQLLDAVRLRPSAATVDEFCRQIEREGGAVPVDRISELFSALTRVRNALVLIEYRDAPRAGPDGRYQNLGPVLGAAVAAGVHVGMLVPFHLGESTGDQQHQRSGASWAEKYMIDVQDACRQAFSAFRLLAQSARAPSESVAQVDARLRLYFPGRPTLNLGFQAKLFYIQYDVGDEGTLTRDHKVLQWVSTPPKDFLLYRGDHIRPEAIRDSFFPIPHAFDGPVSALGANCGLPDLPANDAAARDRVEAAIKEKWEGHHLPFGEALWVSA